MLPLVFQGPSGVPTEPMLPNFGGPTTVAGAGTVLANAVAVTARFTIISGADNTVGAVLPTGSPGDTYFLYSSAATNGLKVYPPSGGTINGGSANAEVVMEGKTAGLFVCLTGLGWAAMFTANA